MKHIEENEQIKLFDWARHIKALRWMYAVPNGGRRNIREAARLKRQGVKAGVADIHLPYPMPPYHGLFIELKRHIGTATVTDKQQEFLQDMELKGYKVAVCRGFEEARATIVEYMKL